MSGINDGRDTVPGIKKDAGLDNFVKEVLLEALDGQEHDNPQLPRIAPIRGGSKESLGDIIAIDKCSNNPYKGLDGEDYDTLEALEAANKHYRETTYTQKEA